MIALTLLFCSTVREFYDLLDAVWHNGFNFTQSLQYYRTKRRLQLFRFYCSQHWLRLYKEKLAIALESSMDRSMDLGVDVTDAYDAADIDSFGYRQMQFLDAERKHYDHLDSNLDDIEVIDGSEFSASFYEYADALPKYYNDQIGLLSEGVSFTINGKLPINCERFSINFVYNNETRDVALHINPRLPQSYIVRNTKVHDVWGREEVSSALPFLLRRGDRFSIQILVTDDCYMISVNGHHFAKYKHRLPYDAVRILEVKGDVDHVEMQRSMVQTYPQRLPNSQARKIELKVEADTDEIDADMEESIEIPREWCLISVATKQPDGSPKSPALSENDQGLTLPYYGALPPKSLTEGRCLKIQGRVRLLPHSFYINLQQGQDIWPHPVIAFHLNPRFSQTSSGSIGKAVVCRNAWYDGNWAEEERSELNTNFRPGRTFSLVIACSSNSFEVYVNKQFITEFKYHVKPEVVDTVYIQGDVKLWNVTLEQNSMVKGKNVRIYHNPIYTEEY